MTAKISLEPTAALVIDLAGKFYDEDPLTKEFVKNLDLSSGLRMIDDYKKSGIYDLTRELISNRKFIIREAVLNAVRQNSSPAQVLILAAGKAPLALELLEREDGKIAKIYEVDTASLDEKKALYQKISPELCNRVAFFQGDIRGQNLMENLAKIGFDPSLYTVIVLEGITHYVTENELAKTLGAFASPDHKQHCVVIDFGPPYQQIAPRIQPIAREAYRIIEDDCYLQPMTKHTAGELGKIFQEIGGAVIHHYTISDIEKMRTGRNEFFPEKNSGWLEYMVAHV
jgi:O-methyltransferase involved in polyketide biosynthesis